MKIENFELNKHGIPIMNNVSVEAILLEPERKEQERKERELKKFFEENDKKCWICAHSLCIHPFPYECSKRLPDETGEYKCIHHDCLCPEEMTCEYFEIDKFEYGVDKREIWINAINIIID